MTGLESTHGGATAHVDAFGLTDVGKVRQQNEDQFAIARLSRSLRLAHTSLENVSTFERFGQTAADLFVVADGVGGVAGGELASGTAVQALTEYIAQTAGCYYNVDVTGEHEFLDRLEQAARHAHDRVRAFSSKGQGPATTLTMVTLLWPRAYIVHIGDSRGYHLRGDRLRQFTRDQTMGELLADEGVVTEQQARDSGLDNVLVSAVGAEITPSIGVLDLRYDDTLLLCSDGLTKHVADEQIAGILRGAANATAACEQLVQAALDDGGSDNVTVVVARMGRPTG
ncbi:MAG: protein phosphatase 2C domain-containing protein [Gemmatimonadota bacterium]|nr:protein phosphatase 2C domain-containing protein [Gemmatimonadota bacterium]